MEPADIDWKKVDSRFVRDEAYEHIDAPKWLDLAAPDDDPAMDDVAFFCRPDCRHPTAAEDFQRPGAVPSPKAKLLRSSSERLPFGERSNTLRDANNLKKRAGLPASVPSSSPLRPKAAAAQKKPRDDLENQDPNQVTPPPRAARHFGAYKADKAAKEMIKSSAEKKVPEEEEEEEERQQKKAQPRLKSTMSARNLFSGKDILSQISEFCHELKKMAAGIRRPPSAQEQEEPATTKAKAAAVEEMELVTPKKESGKVKKGCRMAARIEVEKRALDENSALLKEVRALPPTPQRFPSPSSHGRSRNLKSTSVNAGSPLRKPPKSSTVKGSVVLQEVVQNVEERATLLPPAKDEGCNKASVVTDIEEGGGVFWFLKPCTYLVK